MRRGQSACGGLLPAPAEQNQSDEAGGEEGESGGKWRSRNRDTAGASAPPKRTHLGQIEATHRGQNARFKASVERVRAGASAACQYVLPIGAVGDIAEHAGRPRTRIGHPTIY